MVFWALWFTIAFVADLIDIGQLMGWLPQGWVGSSHNFDYLLTVTKSYVSSWPMNFAIYLGVVAVVGVAWSMHLRAALTCYYHPQWMKRVLMAFASSLSLYFFFMVGCELFIAYQQEHDHIDHTVLEIATLLLILSMRRYQAEDLKND